MSNWKENVKFIIETLNTPGGRMLMLIGGVTASYVASMCGVQRADIVAASLAGALLGKLKSEG